jgi:hypothetical protein
MSTAQRLLTQNLGWRLDDDLAAGDEFRVIQFTPRGSE